MGLALIVRICRLHAAKQFQLERQHNQYGDHRSYLSRAAGAPAEAWLFIGPVNLRKVTPDAGFVIKNGSQNMADLNFYHFYHTPGNYKATFLGGRVSIDESNLTPHNIEISVQ